MSGMIDFVGKLDQPNRPLAIVATPVALCPGPAPAPGFLEVGWAGMRRILVRVICAGTPL